MTTPVQTAKSNEPVQSEIAAAAYPYILESNNAELIRKWKMFDHLLQAAILLNIMRAVQPERDGPIYEERRQRGSSLKKALKSQLGVLRKALAASLTFSNTVMPVLGRLGDHIGQNAFAAVLEVEIALLEEALRQAAVTYSEKRLGLEIHPLWLLHAEKVVEIWGDQQGLAISLSSSDVATLMDVVYLLREDGADLNPVDPASAGKMMNRLVTNPKNATIVALNGFKSRPTDNSSSVKATKKSKS